MDSQNFICRRIPRLNEQQISICESNADILPVLRAGIQLAIKQCERLFASHQTVHHAWNCQGWLTNSSNRLYVDITHPEIAGKGMPSVGGRLDSQLTSLYTLQAPKKPHLRTLSSPLVSRMPSVKPAVAVISPSACAPKILLSKSTTFCRDDTAMFSIDAEGERRPLGSGKVALATLTQAPRWLVSFWILKNCSS